jgi:hypothetical protein
MNKVGLIIIYRFVPLVLEKFSTDMDKKMVISKGYYSIGDGTYKGSSYLWRLIITSLFGKVKWW